MTVKHTLKKYLSPSQDKIIVAYRVSYYRLTAEVKVCAPISIRDMLWRPKIKGIVDMQQLSNGPRTKIKWRHSMTYVHILHCAAHPKHAVTYLSECRFPTQ